MLSVAITLSALATALWAAGTALSITAQQGRRVSRSSQSPMPTRLLRSVGVIVLGFGAGAFYEHHHDGTRLAVAIVVGVGLLLVTTVIPILVHNFRVGAVAH